MNCDMHISFTWIAIYILGWRWATDYVGCKNILTRTDPRAHVTSVLKKILHWLPISQLVFILRWWFFLSRFEWGGIRKRLFLTILWIFCHMSVTSFRSRLMSRVFLVEAPALWHSSVRCVPYKMWMVSKDIFNSRSFVDFLKSFVVFPLAL